MNEAAMSSLDAQIHRFRLMNNHASGCYSLKPQPKQEGFQYDVYIVMHCDCFISLKDPTFEEKVKFVRHMASHFGGVHTLTCHTSNPVKEKYRDHMVWLTRNCNCWLSEVDKPAEPAYTEPMTPDHSEEFRNLKLTELKAEVAQIRAKALGPHLDTPIYDQLAREYDKRYNNMNFFDSELSKRLQQMGQRNH